MVWGDIIVDSLLLWCRLLWFVLVSLPAALHLALIKPSVLSNLTFFRPLHHIEFHPAAREKKRDYLFFLENSIFFWVHNVFLMFLLLFKKNWTVSLFVCYAYALCLMVLTYLLPATCFFFFGLVCTCGTMDMYCIYLRLLSFLLCFLVLFYFFFYFLAVVARSG